MVQGQKMRWWAEQAWCEVNDEEADFTQVEICEVFSPPHGSCCLPALSLVVCEHIFSPGQSTAEPPLKAQHQTHTDIIRMAGPFHQLHHHASPAMGCSLCVTAPRPGRHKPHSQSTRERQSCIIHASCLDELLLPRMHLIPAQRKTLTRDKPLTRLQTATSQGSFKKHGVNSTKQGERVQYGSQKYTVFLINECLHHSLAKAN